MPLGLQVIPGAPYFASEPANEHKDPQPQLKDDLDCPPVHGPERAERRDLVIHHFLFFQAPQTRAVGSNGG